MNHVPTGKTKLSSNHRVEMAAIGDFRLQCPNAPFRDPYGSHRNTLLMCRSKTPTRSNKTLADMPRRDQASTLLRDSYRSTADLRRYCHRHFQVKNRGRERKAAAAAAAAADKSSWVKS